MTTRTIFLLLGLLFVANTQAQVMPRAGTHFTFGIPEGSDGLIDPIFGTDKSLLIVNILSMYDGRGIITSPSGLCQEFTFTHDSVTTILLPYSLMHLKDIGKTNKGVLIKTSEPANVVFHDYLAAAGEATQIYPDEALDTSYRITSWGIFNDTLEDNHSQFIVAAPEDNTDLTIVPSVNTLGNHPANVPIKVSLNRGECYIVKADSDGSPRNPSLSNSTVSSSKPVSIIAGVSCAYNPIGEESCDEIIDQVLPKKYTDTIFYVVPLRDNQVTNTVLFTSEVKDYFVKASDGTVTSSTNGRAQLNISAPTSFKIISSGPPAPAQCFLLSEGSTNQIIGDPSIVTILPRSQYVDTLIWYTPAFNEPQNSTTPFWNYVSLVYPAAVEGQVLLDGIPIASQSAPVMIGSSQMKGTVAAIKPGVHRITSPAPVSATVSGFAEADGYSFVPGSVAPRLPPDTIPTFLDISTVTPAKTCRNFDVAVSAKFVSLDNITSAVLNVTYDPNILTLVSVNLGTTAQGGSWITDTRIPGVITISASCMKAFTDSGALALLTFSAGPKVTSTTISARLEEMGGKEVHNIIAGASDKIIDILEVRDTLKALFTIDGSTTNLTGVDTATVRLVSIPNQPVNEIDLFVTYDHDLLSLQYADLANTLLPGLANPRPTPIDATTDEIRIPLQAPIVFSTPGIITRLIFSTYVSDSSSAAIALHTVISNTRPCPLDILSDQVAGEFTGTDICGSELLRSFLQHQPFVVNSIIPNPSNGMFTITLERHLFGEPLHISLIDQLGNEVWSTYYESPDIHEEISCTVDRTIPNGSYFIRINGLGKTETRKLIIRN